MTALVHTATGLVLFSQDELASPDTGEVRLANGFGEMLVTLRGRFGLPMRVTSCCRTPAHNAAVGGHPRSLHLTVPAHMRIDGAAAIDVTVGDGVLVRRLLAVALEMGWSVGVAGSFVHLDRRDLAGLPPAVFGC